MNNLPPPRKKVSALPPPRRKPLAIAFQNDMFGDDGHKSEYTSKITAPIYEPKNKKPTVFELLNSTKVKRLIRNILESKVTEEEKTFLVEAAKRHNVFNYRSIADYYAHSEPEMQRLMEESALVIIDFDDALKYGYVKYSEEIAKLYVQEHGKTD